MEEEKLLFLLKYTTSVLKVILVILSAIYSHYAVANNIDMPATASSLKELPDGVIDSSKSIQEPKVRDEESIKHWAIKSSHEFKENPSKIIIKTSEIEEKDIGWANEVSNKFKEAARQEIINKFISLKDMQGRSDELKLFDGTKGKLRVFVSSSMTAPLLRAYLKEASKLGASVVLKGLPGNSFKELMKLITEINDSKGSSRDQDFTGNIKNDFSNLQIDDEAFSKFGITQVPSIVLSKNDGENFLSGSLKDIVFDKIDGAISINAALQKFADEGDLSSAAEKWLEEQRLKAGEM